MWKGLIPLVLFVALAIALAIGLTKDPSKLNSVMIDQPLPAFELTDLYDENSVISNEEIAGKVVLINVFGSWCVACVQEHPMLVEISQRDEVFILGVDWRDTRVKGKAWLEHYGNPYDLTVFDAESLFAIDLGITGAPESFLVDKSGRIRYKHVGIITGKVWKDILAPMVKTLETEL
jgi:cytochrome c biogenesis protein CcmG/thiol:disulfide interchange protein DsbE